MIAKLVVAANETPGFAFVALHTDYSHGAKFVVYAPNWPLRSATVLLDATSDIDGYAELSAVRVQEAVPEANYTQLEATLLDGPSYLTSDSPKDLWQHKDTRTPLLKWMHKCVLQSTQAGEKVLVVTWKSVIEGGQLQLLNWEGRHVSYCHFGAGVGSNEWRECSVVFVFGTYVKPARVTIAETHGIKETPFIPGPDASMRGLSGDYRTTQVGLALRWFKQLAMRGCARELNENGVSKPMRLYLATNQPLPILEHWGRMFPGAPTPKTLFVEDDEPATETKT